MSQLKLNLEDFNLSSNEITAIKQANGAINLIGFTGPLTFSIAKNLARLISFDQSSKAIVFDFSNVPFIDTSASMAINEIILSANENGLLVFITELQSPVEKSFFKLGTLDSIPKNQRNSSRLTAIQEASQLISKT